MVTLNVTVARENLIQCLDVLIGEWWGVTPHQLRRASDDDLKAWAILHLFGNPGAEISVNLTITKD